MIVDELVALLGIRLEGQEKVRQFRDGIRGAGQSLNQFAREAARMGAIVGAAVAGTAAVMGRAAIQTGAQFERMEATLRIIEGSAEKARASLDWVTEFAETTPYQLGEVSDAFVRMRAYGMDPMNGSFRAVGDAAAAMGKSIMEGIEAIADASQGENERLKEFGIRAEKAGDSFIYSWQQNGRMLSRTVSANATEITNALTDIFNARFAGAMEAQAKTFDGLMGNIGDRWVAFKLMVADAGWFDFVKGQAKAFIDLFDRLRREGVVDRYATQISGALVAMGSRLRSFAEVVGPAIIPTIEVLGRGLDRAGQLALFLGSTVARVVNAATGLNLDENSGLMLLIAAVLAARKPSWFVLAAIAAALEDIVTHYQGGESVFGSIVDWIRELSGVSQGVAESIAAISVALIGLMALRPVAALKGIAGLAAGILGGLGGAAAAGAGGAGAAAGGGLLRLLGRALPGLAVGGAVHAFASSQTPTPDEQGQLIQKAHDWAAAIREFFGSPSSGGDGRLPITNAMPAGMGMGAMSASPGLSGAAAAGLAAGAVPGGVVNSNNQTNANFNFNQTFNGSPLTEGQVRAATRDGALDAIRQLGSTANPGSP